MFDNPVLDGSGNTVPPIPPVPHLGLLGVAFGCDFSFTFLGGLTLVGMGQFGEELGLG